MSFNYYLKKFFASLKIVSQLLKEANHNLELAVTPVQELMITIQNQDTN
ncbi:hypothetical protein KHA80_17560 [Anaerobacillus sp. HL2]|nr:hypothetical protein KHA80_17560 [Anaerobacillus sp. HL2]